VPPLVDANITTIPADWEFILKWSVAGINFEATLLPLEGEDDPVLSHPKLPSNLKSMMKTPSLFAQSSTSE